MKLNLIIVTSKRPFLLKNCLESIPQNFYKKIDLLVILNGKDCQTEQILRQKNVPHKTIGQTTPAMARNMGIEQARPGYDYIGFADDDIMFSDQYFDHLIKIFKTKTWDVLGGPDTTYPNSSPLETAIGLALTAPLCMGPTRWRHIVSNDTTTKRCHEQSLGLWVLWFRGEIFSSGYRFNPDYFRNEENVLLHELAQQYDYIGYCPKLYVFHKRKDNLGKLFLAVSSSGYYRLKSFFQYPKSSSLLYFVPLLFVFYLVSLIFFHHVLWVSILFFYTVLNIFFALTICIKAQRKSLVFQVMFIQFFINVSYGIGFLKFMFLKNHHLKKDRGP